VNEYAEDLDLPALPEWAEEFLAEDRAWHRWLRATGLMTREEAAAAR
jgi:hypothetical protein